MYVLTEVVCIALNVPEVVSVLGLKVTRHFQLLPPPSNSTHTHTQDRMWLTLK